jgi:hypothetical protein
MKHATDIPSIGEGRQDGKYSSFDVPGAGTDGFDGGAQSAYDASQNRKERIRQSSPRSEPSSPTIWL